MKFSLSSHSLSQPGHKINNSTRWKPDIEIYILCAFQEFEENPINELLGWYGYENDSRPESTRPNNNNNNNNHINNHANSDISKQEEEKKNREARKQRLLKCVAEITPIIRQSMESNSVECSGKLCEAKDFIS